MARSALGGLATGLMQGMEFADDRRRKKKVDRLIDQEYTDARNKDIGAYKQYLNEGGDPMSWSFLEEDQDPFLIRQFTKLREKFGRGVAGEEVDPYEQARNAYTDQLAADGKAMSPVDPSPNPFVGYADGGRVREEDRRRAVPAPAQDEGRGAEIVGGAGALIASSPRARGAIANASRSALPIARRGASLVKAGAKRFAPVAAGVAAGKQFGADYDERMDQRFGHISDAGDPSLWGFTKWAGRRLLGLASDTGNVLTFGQAGRLYRDRPGFDEEEAPAPQQRTALPAPQEAAIVEQTSDVGPSDDQVAQQAKETAIEQTPGHPDHPDQDWNWSEQAAAGFSPEDIPYIPVDDWRQYRRRHVSAGVQRGQSVAEANAEVDQLQHQGFLRNFRQAAYLNMAGDKKGAALAAKAAYQYFPNGSNIRFAAMQGPDGEEYLVGVGYNEETGEVVGQPQPMTEGYLNAMLANFEDPKAFNAWKADQDEAYRLEREYNEITKPQAQATLDETVAKADYYRSGASKNRAEAAAEGTTAGPSEANKIAADKEFKENVDMLALEDPRRAEQLSAIMSRLYASGQGTTREIIAYVNALAEQPGGLDQFIAEYADE